MMEKIKINFDSCVMPRSGSTLYKNILNEVFTRTEGGGIRCSHNLLKDAKRPIALYREFRDVLVSHWRINHGVYKNGEVINKIGKLQLLSSIASIKTKIAVLDKFCEEHPDTLLVKYEDFWDNPNNLIDSVSEYLDVEVPEELRRVAIEKNKIEDAKKISDKQGDDFSNFDIKSGLHGRHIYKGKPGGWKDLVEEELHDYLNLKLGDDLRRYGYE